MRLEHRHDPPVPVDRRVERGSHLGRVVGVVIEELGAVHDTAILEAAPHAGEGTEGLRRHRGRDARLARGDDGRGSVAEVVHAGNPQADLHAFAVDFELGARARAVGAKDREPRVRVAGDAVGHCGPSAAVQHVEHTGVVGTRHHAFAPVQECGERVADLGAVPIEVQVILVDVRDHSDLGSEQ